MALLNTGKPMMEDTTSATPCFLRAAPTAVDDPRASGLLVPEDVFATTAALLGSVISAKGLTRDST